METPNKHVPNPPPFMYHPELFPELAKNNPEPYQGIELIKKEKLTNTRVAKLGFSSVNNDSDVQDHFTQVNPDVFERERYFDYAYYNVKEHDVMQQDFEIDIAKKLDHSRLIGQGDTDIAVEFKIY
jgi:hypothetical protein